MKTVLLTLLLSQVTLATTVYDLSVFKKSVRPENVLTPFESDACSVIDEGPKENPKLLEECCVEHDFKYWVGGSEEDRKVADQELYQCAKTKTNAVWARMIYLGVRFGGSPHSSETYRWGYGWTQLRGYKPFTDHEKKQIEELSSQVKNKMDHIQLNPKQTLEPVEFVSKNFCEEHVLSYFAENTNYGKVSFFEKADESLLEYHIRPLDSKCLYRVRMSRVIDAAYCSRYENMHRKERIIHSISKTGKCN